MKKTEWNKRQEAYNIRLKQNFFLKDKYSVKEKKRRDK